MSTHTSSTQGLPFSPLRGSPLSASPKGQLNSSKYPYRVFIGLARRWRASVEQSPRYLSAILGAIPFLALVAIVIILFHEAFPAIKVNGGGFVTHSKWSVGNEYANPIKRDGVATPVGATYGAWPLILGTLEASALALVIAVPVSLLSALIVVEKLSARASRWVGVFLEILVGIPSVIYGLWGALTLGPFLAHHLAPIANHIPNVPILRFFRGPTYNGEGLLTAGVVLGIMIIPIIASTARDLIRQVPASLKDGGRAIGMTDFEVSRKVIWPWIKSGIVGATFLGLGRALGETMAVLMTCGAVLGTTAHSIFSNMNTIAATIVSQLDSAQTDGTGFAVRSLAELGCILIVITLICNIGAKLLLSRATHDTTTT